MNPTSSLGPPPRRPGRNWLDALYTAVWRWHFWAGLLSAPFLTLLSLTGAIYVFQEDLNVALRPDLHRVERPGGAEMLPYQTRLESALAHAHASHQWASFARSPSDLRSDEFVFEKESETAGDHEHLFLYIDPYTAGFLGSQRIEDTFFAIVLKLHRTLLAGSFGRALVEISTSWGIVSLVTGMVLWIPRGKNKIAGVLTLRLNQGRRVLLRDLHTVPGFYIGGFAFAIMFTGLLYTQVWGSAALGGLYLGGGLPAPYVSPPQSRVPESGGSRASLDSVMEEAHRHYRFRHFHLQVPHGPEDPWVISSATHHGDLSEGAIYMDAYTAEPLATIHYPSLSFGAKAFLLFYSIHTGSIFGMATQIAAVASCLAIIAMSVTGAWMWWRRRPKGRFGAPRKSRSEHVPRVAAVLIVLLGLVFPMVGITLVLMAVGQEIRSIVKKS